MKSFKVTWYLGSVENKKQELRVKIVEADDINAVKFRTVLPEDIRNKVMYTRTIFLGSDKVVIDYGSHTKFIEVREIRKNKEI